MLHSVTVTQQTKHAKSIYSRGHHVNIGRTDGRGVKMWHQKKYPAISFTEVSSFLKAIRK
jgi:hypothetical protein